MFSRAQPHIEFTCDPIDFGVIAEPVPAKTHLPDWFRKLPPVDENHVSATNNGMTVKRCLPFLDAMTAGWIIPLAATVRLEILDAGRTLQAGWEFDHVMVSNHNAHQIAGHPREPRPASKFHNYWTIKTPPGWSCLFVPPLNRNSDVFEIIAGVVDTDTYYSFINFPFVPIAPDGVYILERGIPLVQVIPFRRDASYIDGVVRAETPGETEKRGRIVRSMQASEGWYRDVARAKR